MAILFAAAFYVTFAFLWLLVCHFVGIVNLHFLFIFFLFLVLQKVKVVRQVDDQIKIGELQKQQSVDHQVFLISAACQERSFHIHFCV